MSEIMFNFQILTPRLKILLNENFQNQGIF